MKQKLKKQQSTILGKLFVLLSLTLYNCQKDDHFKVLESDAIRYRTIERQQAKLLFDTFKDKKKKETKQNRMNDLKIDPQWNTFDQKELDFTDALLSHVAVTMNVKTNMETKLIFIAVDDQLVHALQSKEITETYASGKLKKGSVYYHFLDGQYIDGYKIEEGIATKRYVVKERVQQASMISLFSFFQDCDEGLNPNSTFCSNTLDEVVISSNGSSGSPVDPGLHDFLFNSAKANLFSSGSSGGRGGGSGGAPIGDAKCKGIKVKDSTGKCVCPAGYAEDASGKCVKKPCVGDPVKNPEIAPQTNSGIKGGMHDTCARRNKKYTCKGIRGRKWHNGVDLKNPQGAPIYAIYDGIATIHTQRDPKTGKLNGAGYYSAIVSTVNGKRVRMVYFHLQQNKRVTGSVKAGDIIGYQGDSGNLKNGIKQGYAISHLHIKTQVNGANDDPLNHIKTQINTITGQITNPCK